MRGEKDEKNIEKTYQGNTPKMEKIPKKKVKEKYQRGGNVPRCIS